MTTSIIPGWFRVAGCPASDIKSTAVTGYNMRHMMVCSESDARASFYLPVTGEPGDTFFVSWTTFNGEGWDHHSVRASWENDSGPWGDGWEVVTTSDGEDCDGRLRTVVVHYVTADEQALGGVRWKLLDCDRNDEFAQEAGY